MGTPADAAKRDARAPLRVCYLLGGLGRGGTELRVLRLIEGLDRQRVQPFLCLLDGEDPDSYRLEPRDCPVLRLGVRSLRNPSTLVKSLRLARFLRRHRIDVLELYSRDAALVGAPIGRLAGTRRNVITAFNLGYWMTPLDRWLMRGLRPFLDAAVTNCEAAREAAVRELGLPRESVAVLGNGIDLSPFEAEGARPPPAPDRSPQRVGMVANLRPVKDPLNFVEAARRVLRRRADVVFRIAGDGELRGALEEQARDPELSGHLELLGSVDRVPEFLRELDVAVLCSFSEGSSNALIEYMAAGLPAVVTDVGGNSELIEDGVTGLLVPPGDPEALSRALERLLGDAPLRLRIGSAARARAFADSGAEAMCERFMRFYRELLDGKPEPGSNAPEVADLENTN